MYTRVMRTTIELRAEHRARLLELAARRGEKGFSSVIAEAVDSYLESAAERERQVRSGLAARGKLSPHDEAELREAVRHVREFWR